MLMFSLNYINGNELQSLLISFIFCCLNFEFHPCICGYFYPSESFTSYTYELLVLITVNLWGLSSITLLVNYLWVVRILNNLGGVFFCVGILGGFEVFEITLDRMGGYFIPVGYITNVHGLEMDIKNGILNISGFWGGIMWSHCCHWKIWQYERLIFPVFMRRHFFTQPAYDSENPSTKFLIGLNYLHPQKCCTLHINNFTLNIVS